MASRGLGFGLLLLWLGSAWAEVEEMVGHEHHHPAETKTITPSDNSHQGHDHAMPASPEGFAPEDARDPHAYSDGYGFGEFEHPEMGDEQWFTTVIVDRLESTTAQTGTFLTYDWQASLGTSFEHVVARAEGEIEDGAFRDARNELLWGHALTPYWDSQLGVRYDAGMGAQRGWLALGLQGLAPYWLYVEATGYVGEEGRTAFRLETEYDLLLTQRLILQPRMELNVYGRRDDSRLVSSGLSDLEAGIRLRYEVKREFAPYIGVEWSGRFGSAADLIEASGSSAEQVNFVAGVHVWF